MTNPTEKRAGIPVGPAPTKKPRFSKFKKSAAPKDVPRDPKQQTAFVVLVKPDSQSETSCVGLVISPTGFQMDRFLAQTLYKKAGVTQETCDTFVKDSKCVHRVLKVKAEDGSTLVKYNDGKFHPVLSAFIPVDDLEDIDTPEKVAAIVSNFGIALWGAIDKNQFGYAKFEETPSVVDYQRDVRTVTNYSDIIENPEDILVVHRLALSKHSLKLKDWLNADGDDNLYSLFKPGKIPYEHVASCALPFHKFTAEDQKAYQEWCLVNGTPRKGTPGTPSVYKGNGTPSTIGGLSTLQSSQNSPEFNANRSLDDDLSKEHTK